MNTPDNQRSRLTKKLLKQSYLELMCSTPVSKITVKDICLGAEVNRSTFYLHYSEPNDILKELEDETVARTAEFLTSIGAQTKAPAGAKDYLLSFLKYIRSSDELFRALLVRNSDPHFRRKLQAVAENMVETAFDFEIPPEYKSCAFQYIFSGSIELLTDWIRNDYAVSEHTMCDILYLLCEGSLTNICV